MKKSPKFHFYWHDIMYTTSVPTNDVLLIFGTAIFGFLIVLFFKYLFPRIRRPNGKKHGILSAQITCATILLILIAVIVQDVFIIILTLLFFIFLCKTKLNTFTYYPYQIVSSIILGTVLSGGILYVMGKLPTFIEYGPVRDSFNDMPKSARDERADADFATELKLE